MGLGRKMKTRDWELPDYGGTDEHFLEAITHDKGNTFKSVTGHFSIRRSVVPRKAVGFGVTPTWCKYQLCNFGFLGLEVLCKM